MKPEKRERLERTFYSLITAGCNLNDFCNQLAKEAGNPVSIHLPSRTIIARSDDYSKDLVEDFVNAFATSSVQDTTSLFDSIINRLKNRRALAEAFPYYRYMQVLCGCFHNNHIAAILDCPIVDASTDLDETKEIFEIAAKAATTLLLLNNYLSRYSVHHMQIYLSSLLKGNASDLYQQLSVSGSAIDGTEQWQIIRLYPESDAAFDTLERSVDRFCAVREKIWCVEYDNNMIVLMDASLGHKIRELHQICEGLGTMVVSESFPKLTQVQDAFRLCDLALRVARYEDSDDTLIFVQKYKSPIYFLYMYTNDKDYVWGSGELDVIKNHDLRHGTDYFPTIRAYLLCSGDYTAMAEKLHVHKNTIIYRIQRIGDLFELDLKDIRTTTSLYLSLFTALLPVS